MEFLDVTSKSTVSKLLETNGIIFKHSERCGISQDRRQVLADAFDDDDLTIHMVEVREQRGLSDYIEEATGISHESPQVLVVREGDVVWSASHMAIDPDEIRSKL